MYTGKIVKNKKIAECLLIIFMVFGAALPCDTGKSDMEKTLPEKAEELVWFCDDPRWEPEPWQTESESGTGKITKETGARIRYVIPEDSGDSRLGLMLINGDVPDIISVSDKRMRKHLIESGVVWDMEELLLEYLPNSEILKKYPEDIKKEMIERDKGWYGLAANLHSNDNQNIYGRTAEFFRELQEIGQDCGIIWNKALLKRMGLPVSGVKTKKELMEAFQAVSDRGITVNGVEVTPVLIDGQQHQGTTIEFLADSFGAEWADADGKYRERICTEEGKEVLEFLNELVRKGYISEKQMMYTPYQVRRQLNSGQVLCYIGDVRHSGINPEEWVSSGAILSESGKSPCMGITQKAVSEEMTTFISKECENPEAAARWIDFMYTESGMRLYMESGEEWWPMWNEDWFYANCGEPDSTQKAWRQILCAYARTPQTCFYDKSQFDFQPEEGNLREIETAIEEILKKGINRAVLSETKELFEENYRNMLNDLEASGIHTLEKARTNRIKK